MIIRRTSPHARPLFIRKLADSMPNMNSTASAIDYKIRLPYSRVHITDASFNLGEILYFVVDHQGYRFLVDQETYEAWSYVFKTINDKIACCNRVDNDKFK